MLLPLGTHPRRTACGSLLVLLALVSWSCKGDANAPPDPATVTVTISTTGDDLPTNWTFAVSTSDGSVNVTGQIPVNGSRTFTGVPAGVTFRAELSGLSDNCTLSSQNPQTITTAAGGTHPISFEIDCLPNVGDIQVNTATTGTVGVPAEYEVWVVHLWQDVAATGSVTFSGLPADDYSVELRNVPGDCEIDPGNPQLVAVTFGATTPVSFQVTCPVELTVHTQTTGGDLDPDGYSLSIDSGTPESINTSDTKAFQLLPGDHTIELSGVAANCTVTDPNPRTLTLPADQDLETTFEVVCEGPSGSIRVTTVTSGWDHPVEHGLDVDGDDRGPIGANTTLTIDGIDPGTVSVSLTGLPAYCFVQEGASQSAVVTEDGVAELSFTVVCGGIAYTIDGPTSQDIFIKAPDVSAWSHPFATTTGTEKDPSWSPDRNKIAYACSGAIGWDICVKAADGSQLIRLLSNGATNTDPAWSPDGNWIAFESNQDGDREIYVMSSSPGGTPVQLTNNALDDEDPSWSSGSDQIAYHSDVDGDDEIYVVTRNLDGSWNPTPQKLTDNFHEDEDADWSPDGNSILFVSDRDGDKDIYVMDVMGGNVQQLTFNLVEDDDPAWSPDGLMIVFTREVASIEDLWTMTHEGFALTNITNTGTVDEDEADWR